MSGPLGRILAQVIVVGANVVSKAFLQAYQQAVHNAKSGKGQQAAQQAARAMRNKMEESEALKVLNFEKRPMSTNEVLEQYNRYFTANDPKKGGSFYLQSKINNAKEVLIEEIGKSEDSKPGAETTKEGEEKPKA